MSDLTNIEKRNLERLFGMSSGYVLDFSNRTFEEFIFDSVGISIFDAKYDHGRGSKANRLRAFWSLEPNHIVGTVLEDLVTCASQQNRDPGKEPLIEDADALHCACSKAHRYLNSAQYALTPQKKTSQPSQNQFETR